MAKDHTTARSTGSEDLKKPRASSGPKSIHSVSNTAAQFVGGSAGSLAAALDVFSQRLKQEDKSLTGFTQAWTTSVLEAYAGFFDQMAATLRRLVDETRQSSNTGRGDSGIDYERLARLVANELRKQKIDDETA